MSGRLDKEPMGMSKETEFKKFFKFTSLVTDVFPSRGAMVLDLAVRGVLGNILLFKFVEWQARRHSKASQKPNRILVAGDLNIGDAIIAQASVAAFKEIFPRAEIDCVVKKSAADLIEGNPLISELYPLYEGAPYPNESDLAGLSQIAAGGKYDLIFNMSPMIDDGTFGGRNVLNYSVLAAGLIRNEAKQGGITNGIVYQSHHFLGEIFRDHLPSGFGRNFTGASIYLSDSAIEQAGSFLMSAGISRLMPIVMINPDASARFTRMPFEFQRELIKRLATMGCSILLGAGHVEKYIEHELMYSLEPEFRSRVTVVPPSTSLDVYAALVDSSDVYISGDTGPLHIAAARKFSRSSGEPLRNRTGVISVFGGTPSRIYGYDSKAPGFFPANQDVPSRTFVGRNQCRNITCINKMAKTCKEVRCFNSLTPGEIALEAASHIERARREIRREKLRILVS